MKRILVTGTRAPAALDLIRRLSNSGIQVYAADSVKYPLSRASNKVKQYFALSQPAKNVQAFIIDLENIIKNHKIDILIPTCEEVFFISRYKERLERNCVVFCDNFEKLSMFHDKYKFLKEAEDCGALIPDTQLICSNLEISKLDGALTKVFKPVFSRFAAYTLIHPEAIDLQKIKVSKNFPWVAQEYIDGTEYCTYSVAVNGKLQAHSCYQPKYRAGIGAGIYFTPTLNNDIHNFVYNFIRKQNYTGQIGFDFILTKDNQLYVLECNPRATSGIHCLDDKVDWKKIISGTMDEVAIASKSNKMVALAMLTFGFKYLFTLNASDFISSFAISKDPVWSKKDMKPAFFQLISLSEIIFKAIRFQISPKEAATADIEWNGEEI